MQDATPTHEKILNISEVFYSLQGEGSRAGEPSIFIRLQGCKAKHACAKSGIVCDTEFESGRAWTLGELAEYINQFPKHLIKDTDQETQTIVWTGGEPADQLTEEIVGFFLRKGYYQCIETSGLHPIPYGIDFISLSPKVAEHILKKNFPNGVRELRYVRHKGQEIPQPSVTAEYYYLSPHSDGWEINHENLKHCIDLCLKNPWWRLSVQQHKIWNVL